MTTAVQAGNTVHVKLAEDDYTQTFRNAEVTEESHSGDGTERMNIVRGDKTIGSFDRSEVKYWFIEEADGA